MFYDEYFTIFFVYSDTGNQSNSIQLRILESEISHFNIIIDLIKSVIYLLYIIIFIIFSNV